MGRTVIILLSTLLCWSHGAPSPAYGIFPLPQVYNNRAPGGFYYFPSLASVRQHLTPSSSVDGLHQSDVAKNLPPAGIQLMKMFNLPPANMYFQCLRPLRLSQVVWNSSIPHLAMTPSSTMTRT